jgi:hypothetical protein
VVFTLRNLFWLLSFPLVTLSGILSAKGELLDNEVQKISISVYAIVVSLEDLNAFGIRAVTIVLSEVKSRFKADNRPLLADMRVFLASGYPLNHEFRTEGFHSVILRLGCQSSTVHFRGSRTTIC